MTAAAERGRHPSVDAWAGRQGNREAFVGILANEGKTRARAKGFSVPVRTRGFAVFVRNARTLVPLQQLCHDPQHGRVCLSARYRLESAPALGTILGAFPRDVELVRNGRERETSGAVLYDPQWKKILAEGYLERVAQDERRPLATPTGEVDREWLAELLRELANESYLGVGRRLVLLCEVAGGIPYEELVLGLDSLLMTLPERVGIVVQVAADAPPLPDDPHLLDLDLGEESAEEDGRVEVLRYALAALRSDRPATSDSLGVRVYAEALASLVLLPETTPLTIGIHGRWGKGKSSFMLLIDGALVQNAAHAVASRRHSKLRARAARGLRRLVPRRLDALHVRLAAAEGVPGAPLLEAGLADPAAPPDPAVLRRVRKRTLLLDRLERRLARDDVVTVQFNAWRYQDSTQIWAGLASTITEELERALPPLRRLATPVAYAWRNRRTELIVDLLLPAAAAVVALVFLATVGADRLGRWVGHDVGAQLPTGTGIALALWFTFGRARRVLKPVSQQVLEYVRRPDHRDRMGYQHLVLDDLRFVVRRLRRGRPYSRVVVFIDDLDRCSDDKIMEILQAINLILGESDFFVFLGIDTGMIHRAIERHYAGREGLPRDFAASYLRKIIQLSFHLPHTAPEHRTAFLDELFSHEARQALAERQNGGPPEPDTNGHDTDVRLRWDESVLRPPYEQVARNVEDTPDELQAFRDFQPHVEDNPRELKRLVNVHRFVKIVLQPEGSPPPEVQRKLVKWLVFCSRWPELVDDVVDFARAQPDSPDAILGCAGELMTAEPGLRELAQAYERISAADLAREGVLFRAAHLSHLVLAAPAPRKAPA